MEEKGLTGPVIESCLTFRSRLIAIAAQVLGPGAQAEDAADEAISRAISNRSSLEPKRLPGWMAMVVKRIAIDRARSNSRRDRALSKLGKEKRFPGPLEALLEKEMAVLLEQAIQTLTDHQRDAFTLRAIHDLPFEEIARRMEISQGAARQLAWKAKGALAATLARHIA